MPERRPPEDFVKDHVVADDGLVIRSAGRWTRTKLGILAMYCPRFVQASRSAQATYFVDGLAGPGLCRIRPSQQVVLGSSLIALKAGFTKVLSLELQPDFVVALQQRTAPFGMRSAVAHGDINKDLLALMKSELDVRSAPTLVFLDPEGFEVDWSTVAAISRFRTGGRRAELLYLAMTSGIRRVTAAYDPSATRTRLDEALPPDRDWVEVEALLKRGDIGNDEAMSRWSRSYENGLRTLGYAYVIARLVTRGTGQKEIYRLVFASDHEVGNKIMRYTFDSMYPDGRQGAFPGFSEL
jgi:three-Cys-motif partner protein